MGQETGQGGLCYGGTRPGQLLRRQAQDTGRLQLSRVEAPLAGARQVSPLPTSRTDFPAFLRPGPFPLAAGPVRGSLRGLTLSGVPRKKSQAPRRRGTAVRSCRAPAGSAARAARSKCRLMP